MSGFEVIAGQGVAQLRAHAATWDDLWRRTPRVAPSARAQAITQWCEHFAAAESLRFWIVTCEGRAVLALPLLPKRGPGGISVADLPSNGWTTGGRLLFDPGADLASAADCLVAACRQAPWKALWLEAVEPEVVAWRALARAWQRSGAACDEQPRYHVGLVDTTASWNAYWASRSRTLRRELKRKEARLLELGRGEYHFPAHLDPKECEPLLQRVLEVEDRSWKAAAGSSVLRSAEAFDYYRAWARDLAAHGELALAWLEVGGVPIASQFGLKAAGSYWCLKIGYDPRYGEFSPGQLLMRHVIESCCGDPAMHEINFVGPLIDATARWTTRTFLLSRWVVADQGLAGRGLVGLLAARRRWTALWRADRQLADPRVRPLGLAAAGSAEPRDQAAAAGSPVADSAPVDLEPVGG